MGGLLPCLLWLFEMQRIYSAISNRVRQRRASLPQRHSSDSRLAPSVVIVTIKQSKTDLFRQGVKLHLGKTGTDICPVCAILPYLAARGVKHGPLFILDDGTFLTRQKFAAMITLTLRRAGIDDK